MRLWIIFLVALFLVGLLIALERSGLFEEFLGRETRTTDMTFPDFERSSLPYIDEGGETVFVAHTYQDAPLILSGFPSYSSNVFLLPTDSPPVRGSYTLVFSSQAVAGTEGALRVSINGIRRGDTVLRPGAFEQRVEFELTPTELAAGEVDVRLALVGHGPMAECTPNEAIAAVVTISPQSGLRLTLNQPPSTIRDRLALWGDLVPVRWNSAATPDVSTLINAARLVEKGYATYFSNRGFSGQELATIETGAPARAAIFPTLRYPIRLTSAADNAGARRFDRETTWRFRYDIAQLPNGELPSALDLRLFLGPIADTRTNLFVRLNDHLLVARALSDADERFNNSIRLPPADHLDQNLLEVTLTATERDELRCGSRRLIEAEMLPDTVLAGGGPRVVTPLAELRQQMAANPRASLEVEALTAPQAQVAASLLGQLRPRSIAFANAGAAASIKVLSGDIAGELANVRPNGRQWVAFFPTDERDQARVVPWSRGISPGTATVALLVTLPQARVMSQPTSSRTPAATPVAPADAL